MCVVVVVVVGGDGVFFLFSMCSKDGNTKPKLPVLLRGGARRGDERVKCSLYFTSHPIYRTNMLVELDHSTSHKHQRSSVSETSTRSYV